MTRINEANRCLNIKSRVWGFSKHIVTFIMLITIWKTVRVLPNQQVISINYSTVFTYFEMLDSI